MAKLNIVLYEPEIPANTGNIGRTCVATGTRLHLIEPLGFRLNEKSIKRAGMDYWDKLDVTRYIDYQDFLEKNPGAKIYMASTKAPKTYTEVEYEDDCYIMFGKESAGIPEEILLENQETAIRIPMIGDIRSLNLGNSVAIVLYEALRQHHFDHMQMEGHLTNYEWKQVLISTRIYFAFSRVKINSVPTPSVLITLMFWWCAEMISFTMERPSPVPFRSFPREESIL